MPITCDVSRKTHDEGLLLIYDNDKIPITALASDFPPSKTSIPVAKPLSRFDVRSARP